ncbi:MAG: hypothetical protein EOP84_15640 [Verrucomicrobiaceae bacterium]|nr:MAG: hypothetical protein EOP84_15640 [Verrucomicrobiaceae bacterium]
MKADTRKLASFEEFEAGIASEISEPAAGEARGPRRPMSLKSFVEQRRAYLLKHPELQKLSAARIDR